MKLEMGTALEKALRDLKKAMKQERIEQEKGIGKELFLFASTLMPVINVDLLVLDWKKRVLLSWRDDPYSGTGWHVPGTCIRFRESLDESVKRCAKEELGTEVRFVPEPVKVYEFRLNTPRQIADQRERGHFITLVYRCEVPGGYRIENGGKNETEPGYLRWFDMLPNDLLPLQECYRKDWETLTK